MEFWKSGQDKYDFISYHSKFSGPDKIRKSACSMTSKIGENDVLLICPW